MTTTNLTYDKIEYKKWSSSVNDIEWEVYIRKMSFNFDSHAESIAFIPAIRTCDFKLFCIYKNPKSKKVHGSFGLS